MKNTHRVEQQANRRLIAAAPELLAALKAILPYAETESESLADLANEDCRTIEIEGEGDGGVYAREYERSLVALSLAEAAISHATTNN